MEVQCLPAVILAGIMPKHGADEYLYLPASGHNLQFKQETLLSELEAANICYIQVNLDGLLHGVDYEYDEVRTGSRFVEPTIGGYVMRIGIASDHAGFALKKQMKKSLAGLGHTIVDFGPSTLSPKDDYPDFVVPLAQAVAGGQVQRGIAICGSGVGACIAANKVKGVRAALISDYFSAHQGVEDDDMNVICFGAQVINYSLAWDLTRAFLGARFIKNKNHQRRLTKVAALEQLPKVTRRKHSS